MKNKIMSLALIVLSVTGLAQCGSGGSRSSEVDVTFVPSSPVIVHADLTLFPGTDAEQKIEQPWYLFRTRVRNGSDTTLTLVTFAFDITNVQNGAIVQGETAIDPSVTCVNSTTASRSYLAVIPAGETFKSLSDGCDPESILGASTDPYESWYIGGLPEADSDNYTVTITGEGWFEDDDGVPVERLVLYGVQSTQ